MEISEIKKKLWASVFTSRVRMPLFMIVSNKENKDMTISDIHKCLCDFCKKDFDYKNTYKHLKVLEEDGFIKIDTKKGKHKQGSPSIVIFKSEIASDIFYQFLKFVEPDLHKWTANLSEDQLDKITGRNKK